MDNPMSQQRRQREFAIGVESHDAHVLAVLKSMFQVKNTIDPLAGSNSGTSIHSSLTTTKAATLVSLHGVSAARRMGMLLICSGVLVCPD